jgi:RNA polymerase sigma factor for flagellar operon FliA
MNEKWFRYFESKDIDLRNELILENINLAKKISSSVSKKVHSFSLSEIKSHAYIGLIKAVEQYNPNLGYTFSTFGSKKIYGAIIDSIRSEGSLSRSRDEDGNHFVKTTSIDSEDLDFVRYDESTSYDITSKEFLEDEDVRMLEEALLYLSERDRNIITLYYIEGYTDIQISKRLKISTSLITKLKPKILESLRRYLNKKFSLEGKDIAA